MKYDSFDHAEWVQRQIDVSRAKTKPMKDRYGCSIGWGSAPERLLPSQARAFHILGLVGGGIYNCPISWDTVAWFDCGIKVTWGGRGLATYDFDELTKFVFLCHAARMRGEIIPAGPRELRITVTEREDATADSSRHHPSLVERVAGFDLPPDHPVWFRAPEREALAA